jgi:hypothetical protein
MLRRTGLGRLNNNSASISGVSAGVRPQERETTPPALIAWHVTERGEKKFWNRIGAAWKHEDGEG